MKRFRVSLGIVAMGLATAVINVQREGWAALGENMWMAGVVVAAIYGSALFVVMTARLWRWLTEDCT